MFFYYTLFSDAAGNKEASISYFDIPAAKKKRCPLIAYLQFIGKKLIYQKRNLNGNVSR
jgi:hypothetical protein